MATEHGTQIKLQTKKMGVTACSLPGGLVCWLASGGRNGPGGWIDACPTGWLAKVLFFFPSPRQGDLGLKAGIWKDGQLSSQACACLADTLPLVAGSCGSLPESPPFLTLPLYPKVTLEEDNPPLPAPSTRELQAPRSGSSLSWMNLLVERPAWEGTQGLVSGAKARDDWGWGSPCFGEHIALGTGKP